MSDGLSSRVETEQGVAGEFQRLLLAHPDCPPDAHPVLQFLYANAAVLLAAIRLAED